MDDRRHHVVVPAVGIVIGDNYRRAVPKRRRLKRVNSVHEEGLLIERIRVHGMSVLVGRGFQETYGWQISRIQGFEKVGDVVLVISLIFLTDHVYGSSGQVVRIGS